MSVLLLEPHNDDATLFAFWTIMREHPAVITCFRSYRMGERGYPEPRVDMNTRERESAAAMRIANVTWEQLILPDTLEPAAALAGLVACLKKAREDHDFTHIYAPAQHEDGNAQHNIVGDAALEAFDCPITFYCTYVNGRERMTGTEVEFKREWIRYKLMALACFDSQLCHPSISHHFTDHGLREWYA